MSGYVSLKPVAVKVHGFAHEFGQAGLYLVDTGGKALILDVQVAESSENYKGLKLIRRASAGGV
ncbi:hypothetical protein [Pelotomaculum propionicicum]|uniref:Uncharacterized protein n=1 Tax=Pelotomaculum propionicicum TaxID=258475 RepID=A0A4Y7RMB7_9FIRM|nr:hypothetical protein Pmgp_02823 [Pelotomaculum propionicicum]